MTLRLFVSLIATLAVAGCPSNDIIGGETGGTGETGGETGSETGAPTEIEFEEFYAAAEVAWCEWQVACRQYGVEARCESVNHMEERLSMRRLSGVGSDEAVPLAYMAEAIEIGRIAYDREAAAACLAYVRAQTCEREYWHVFSEEEEAGRAACEAVFEGRMGRNGPCLSASECAETSICGFDPACVDACCVGACRALPAPIAVGEACNFNQACVADAYCAQDPDTFMPTVCTAAPTAGEQCPQGVCAGDAICDFDGNSQVCIAPRPPGSQCSFDQQCEQPANCTYVNGDFGTCTRPVGEGESCNDDSGAGCLRFDNWCDPGSNTCVALPGKGEPCAGYQCAGDFFCSEAQGLRCVPVADPGERCGYSDINFDSIPCSGDNFCDYGENGDNPTCVSPGSGSTCPVPEDPLAEG
jgi:hypothetical protein